MAADVERSLFFNLSGLLLWLLRSFLPVPSPPSLTLSTPPSATTALPSSTINLASPSTLANGGSVMPSTTALVSTSVVFDFTSSPFSGDLLAERDFAGDFDRVLSRKRLLPDRALGDLDRLLSLSLRALVFSDSFFSSSFCWFSFRRSCSACRFLISSFFCSRNFVGMQLMFSIALSSNSQSSSMKIRAFFAFKNPVRFICMSFPSGCRSSS